MWWKVLVCWFCVVTLWWRTSAGSWDSPSLEPVQLLQACLALYGFYQLILTRTPTLLAGSTAVYSGPCWHHRGVSQRWPNNIIRWCKTYWNVSTHWESCGPSCLVSSPVFPTDTCGDRDPNLVSRRGLCYNCSACRTGDWRKTSF